MVYVKGDGTVVDRDPSMFAWIWGLINFFYLLMSICSFEELLSLLSPYLQKRSYNGRIPVMPLEMLGLTISVQSLINPSFNKHGDKYERDFRPPGSGPPKPPSRKFGGFGPSGSGPSPPPAGGCGCGG